MAQKYSREMINFGQHAPRHRSEMVSKYHGLGICVFGHRKGFDRLEATIVILRATIVGIEFRKFLHVV